MSSIAKFSETLDDERSKRMANQILRIDLSNRSDRVEEIPDKIINQYIGGRGLGAYLLYNSVPPGIDPLGEKNHLIFTAGPSNGTNLSYSSKAANGNSDCCAANEAMSTELCVGPLGLANGC
jgi:hypothetical protein